MSAVQTEILDKISSMTVLELSELIKAMEDKFGVSAAAAVAVAGPAAAPGRSRRGADRVHRRPGLVRREQGQRDQGRARADGPRPEGSQGPGRRRAEARQGRHLEGRRRSREEEARGSGRQGRGQVTRQRAFGAARREPRGACRDARGALRLAPHGTEPLREGEDERIRRQSCSSSSSEATAEDGHGRTSPASRRCACAVVRQRLVEANHHARECNAPDQSMSDGRENSRLQRTIENRYERSRSDARATGNRRFP